LTTVQANVDFLDISFRDREQSLIVDTRRLQLLLSGLKVCDEISPKMANGGEFATERMVV
jgi:hypothetical protein